MSYEYPSQWMNGDSKLENEEISPVEDVPKVMWVPMLVPVEAFYQYWGYPQQAFYEYTVESSGYPLPATATTPSASSSSDKKEEINDDAQPAEAAPAVSCSASADNSDSFSDASTDVGDGDDIADDFDEEPKQVEIVEAPRRQFLFAKLSREQRVDQLKRVTDEYCALEFDSVDATSQGGLALRMLTILKSLSESATFHGDQGRSQEKRLFLLGLGQDDENAIKDVVQRAQVLCEGRLFRTAFDVLQEVAPRLSDNSLPAPAPGQMSGGEGQMSGEEIEAMKQRRLEKRKRQRGERRVQRADDRADRASQRCTGSGSSSAAASSSCIPHKGASATWSRTRS